MVLPAAVTDLLRGAVSALAEGKSLVITTIGKELPLQGAARLLNVSREFVERLVAEGKLAASGEAGRERVRLENVLRLRTQRHAERAEILGRMVEDSEETGLYPEFTGDRRGDEEMP